MICEKADLITETQNVKRRWDTKGSRNFKTSYRTSCQYFLSSPHNDWLNQRPSRQAFLVTALSVSCGHSAVYGWCMVCKKVRFITPIHDVRGANVQKVPGNLLIKNVGLNC